MGEMFIFMLTIVLRLVATSQRWGGMQGQAEGEEWAKREDLSEGKERKEKQGEKSQRNKMDPRKNEVFIV